MTDQELHLLAESWLQVANGEPIYGPDKLAMAHWALRLESELKMLYIRLSEMEQLATSLVETIDAQHRDLC